MCNLFNIIDRDREDRPRKRNRSRDRSPDRTRTEVKRRVDIEPDSDADDKRSTDKGKQDIREWVNEAKKILFILFPIT